MHHRSDHGGRTSGSSLVGRFFLSEPSPCRTSAWQGRVVAELGRRTYVVELYSWLDGTPLEQRLVRLCEMHDWVFFVDVDQWRSRGDELQAYSWRNATRRDDG